MPYAQGNPITATEANALIDLGNKIYGDRYDSTAAPSAPLSATNQNNFAYGWGGSEAANVSVGKDIEAQDLNDVINRTNQGVTITNNTTNFLAIRNPNAKIFATDFKSIF